MLLWWALAGCGSATKGTETVAPPPPPPPPAQAADAESMVMTLHGSVRRRPAGLEITPCGASMETRLEDKTGILETLWESVGDLLVVRGSGVVTGDGVRLDKLFSAHPGGGPPCTLSLGYDWRITGNEPFWAATVTGAVVVIEQPEEPVRTEVPVTAAGLRWTSTGEPKLDLVVSDGPCRDSMSGAWMSHKATITWAGREMTGCAAPGN